MVQQTFFRTKHTKQVLVLSLIQHSVFSLGQIICLDSHIVQNYEGKQPPKGHSLKMAFTVAESKCICICYELNFCCWCWGLFVCLVLGFSLVNLSVDFSIPSKAWLRWDGITDRVSGTKLGSLEMEVIFAVRQFSGVLASLRVQLTHFQHQMMYKQDGKVILPVTTQLLRLGCGHFHHVLQTFSPANETLRRD